MESTLRRWSSGYTLPCRERFLYQRIKQNDNIDTYYVNMSLIIHIYKSIITDVSALLNIFVMCIK